MKKNIPEIVKLKAGDNWCCQSKMCYISIDIHAYMFKYMQIKQLNKTIIYLKQI